MSRYKQIKDGEGFTVHAKTIHKFACCDCGLVHEFVFTVSSDRKTIGVAARRNNRATAARRRKKAP